MNSKILHITFSDTPFNFISSAIESGSLTGSCNFIGGDWHLGPLEKRTSKTLSTWFTEHFGYIPNNAKIGESTPLIDNFTKIFVWANTLSSDEYANFLRWVKISKPRRFFLVSPLGDHTHRGYSNVGDAANFIDAAIEKKSSEIDLYTREWDVLVSENSDFRLINATGRIQSISSSYFDKYIIDSVTPDWEPSPLVVLRIMEKLHAEHQQFPGDIFFYHRLEKFLANSTIEKQADTNIIQTQIRSANP